MSSPIFIVCQGRSGGTFLADALCRADSDMRLLIEPLHPHLPGIVARNPKATDPKLRHRIRPYPFKAYGGSYNSKVLAALHGFYMQGKSKAALHLLLLYLVEGTRGRPVIKLCRMWGRVALLREWFPDARIVFLYRDFYQQWRSCVRVGMVPGYFGELQAYGLGSSAGLDEAGRQAAERAWGAVSLEAAPVADCSVRYEALLAQPAEEFVRLARELHIPSVAVHTMMKAIAPPPS